MKIVRSFKADPHPSIIPFHSFIITPSYALITMYVFFLHLVYLGLGVSRAIASAKCRKASCFSLYLDNHRVSLTDSFVLFLSIGHTCRH